MGSRKPGWEASGGGSQLHSRAHEPLFIDTACPEMIAGIKIDMILSRHA